MGIPSSAVKPIVLSTLRPFASAHSFPGWRNFGAFASHLRFVVDHHRDIERIAVVTDSGLLKVLPRLAAYFAQPTIRRFAPEEKARGLAWLETGR